MNNSLFSHFMPYCVEVDYCGSFSYITCKNREYKTIFKVSTELQITRRKLNSIGGKVKTTENGGLKLFLYESHPEYGETDFDKSERFVEYYLKLTRLFRMLENVNPEGAFSSNC